MKPIHIIAHYRGDLDGLACHSIANRWFNFSQSDYSEIIHHDIVYGREDLAFESINLGDDLIFCDLGFNKGNPYLNALKKLEELRNSGSYLQFFDHHNWPKGLIGKLFHTVHHNLEDSSAPQLARFLLPKDEISEYLGKLAYLDDRNISTEIGDTLTKLLNAQGFCEPLDLIKHLGKIKSKNEILPTNTSEVLREYDLALESSIRELRNSYSNSPIKTTQINFGLSPEMLFMKPGHRQMKIDFQSGINICFYENLPNVMFRTQNKTNYLQLIDEFGGGGRDNEGGFILSKKTTKNNYTLQRKLIFKRLEDRIK